MISRRSLLRQSAGLAALAALPIPLTGRAAGAPSRLLIFFAYGGWDPTYLFDARPDSSDVDTPSGDWERYGDLELWRPSGNNKAHSFLQDWHERVAVINGIGVNSLVHEECARRLLTGDSAGATPDLGARVADALGRPTPLPYMTVGGNAKVAGFEAISGTTGWYNQLSALVAPNLEYETGRDPLRPSDREVDLVRAYLETRAAQLETQSGRAGTSGTRLDDYLESLDREERIREAAARNFLSDPREYYNYDYHTRAVTALAEGFCQAAFLTDGNYWDTHTGNSQQGAMFDSLFTDVAQAMSALEDEGIADDTAVMVLSEMGRSPLLNSEGGKDHWPYTSAMLIGPTVRSRVVQGTDDALHQTPVDLNTGAADSGGRALQSADLLATVAEMMGLDAATLYPEGEVIDAVLA